MTWRMSQILECGILNFRAVWIAILSSLEVGTALEPCESGSCESGSGSDESESGESESGKGFSKSEIAREGGLKNSRKGSDWASGIEIEIDDWDILSWDFRT